MADSPRLVERWRLTVYGIVQGVGFRPFVHRLAMSLKLAGTVHNFTGGVQIELEGVREALEEFRRRLLVEKPPIAVIEGIETSSIEPKGQADFVIVPSKDSEGPIFVSPDVAICADCRRELADPEDRRHRHPFINCTNCGPRFTIIQRLPYDRPQTSMAAFEMCDRCRSEYEDITNRRYHAQPVCCPECGPRVWLMTGDGETAAKGAEAIEIARRLLGQGKIVAVKGLGGFHLACDATNEEAVTELRRRKRRWEKPFAVMAPSVEAVERFAVVDERARELFVSPQAPIVLVPKRQPEVLAASVAPDSPDYGVMVPYTPLHILLLGEETLGDAFSAVVMTSGNLSEEPLCTSNDEALRRLGGLADAFLLHDREILIGCDDSVVRTTAVGAIMMRRARGYVPFPVRLPVASPPALGVGGHLKNTFCLAQGDLAYPSQHIGDLDNAETLTYFERSLERMEELCEIRPELVACDLHPDYLSTRLAHKLAGELGLRLVHVQHHHAHMAACMAENGITGPAIGVICDGTGYGGDGTVWGCEVLVGDLATYTRVGHLRYAPLAGGNRAITEPWRAALAWVVESFGLDVGGWPRVARRVFREVGQEKAEAVLTMIRRGVNCPYASSAGRLFDAVAALAGLRLAAAYEGQAAMLVEAAASAVGPSDGSEVETYPFDTYEEQITRGGQEKASGWRVPRQCLVLDPRPTIRAILEDLDDGVSVGWIARRFHHTFVMMLSEAACTVAEETGLDTVLLSGGTFQNRLVLEGVVADLQKRGLRPVWHRGLSPNDSSICVGQVAVAAAMVGEAATADTYAGRGREDRGCA